MVNERLLFKFYRSYFDVAQELNDKERLEFYDSLMKRQFFGIEPNLKGIVKLAYVSQKHNIDAQIKGWEDKMNIKLSYPMQGGIKGGLVDPLLQLKEKEKEKEEVKEIQPKVVIDWSALLKQFNELVGRSHKLVTEKAKRQLLARLKDGYTKQDIWNAIQNCYNDEYHKETNHKYLTLEFISRPDKMERYSTDIVKKNKNKVNIEL
jgi:uncharacterized phage protein (TIGR02220 family)